MNLLSSSYFTITDTPGCSYWQPGCKKNNEIISSANITSNWKYRQYMQNNAKHIMKYDSMEYVYASGNNPYTITDSKNSNSNVPYRFASLYDPNTPTVGFSDSDLKQDFSKKQQMSSRMVAPAFPAAKP